MKKLPSHIYGFQYKFEGRNYAIDLAATSSDEAKKRLRAVAKAKLIGPLVPLDDRATVPSTPKT
jgi:hypothetical protein